MVALWVYIINGSTVPPRRVNETRMAVEGKIPYADAGRPLFNSKTQ
jgi:hypothetical protein